MKSTQSYLQIPYLNHDLKRLTVCYNYSFKIFLRFWLAKRTRIIHHNQLLLTKFGRTLRLINRGRRKCSTVAGQCTVNREDLGTRSSCFGCETKNGRTVSGTFYSFHDELLSKTQQEDNSTDNICYLEYICRPEQPFIF